MSSVEEESHIRRYSNEKVMIEINEDWCKGCSICAEFCPKKVLAMNRKGKPEVIALDGCTRCQSCDLRCPDFAITVEEVSAMRPTGPDLGRGKGDQP